MTQHTTCQKGFRSAPVSTRALVPKGQNATSLLSEIVYGFLIRTMSYSAELKNQIAFLTLGIPGDISDLGSISQLRFTRVITDHIEAAAVNFFGRSFKEKGVAAEGVCNEWVRGLQDRRVRRTLL